MRNYKKYRSFTIDLFKLFLAEKISKEGLYNGLTCIENDLKQNRATLKSLWFKFFKDDTGATDISNIYNCMEYSANDKYYKECMQIAIDNPKELQIYYS